jgi:hypothetical protein
MLSVRSLDIFVGRAGVERDKRLRREPRSDFEQRAKDT